MCGVGRSDVQLRRRLLDPDQGMAELAHATLATGDVEQRSAVTDKHGRAFYGVA